MPIDDKVLKYSVWISQNDVVGWVHEINLSLESGASVYIAFPKQRPADWLQFEGQNTNLFMTDEFKDVYHLLQTEPAVYFTGLDLEGLRAGVVYTALELSPGADSHPNSIASMVRRARNKVKT